MEKARRANLNNSQTWKQYPERMLAARLHTEVASVLFPDVVTATSGANTYSTEEAAHFSGSREDESKLADVVGVPELAPTEESPSAPPAPAPAPAPARPVVDKLVERVRREAREEGVDPDTFLAFLAAHDIGPPQLPADVHELCERYLVDRTEFNAWLEKRQ
jgi:pyruvate/2-oxoglutarate dehydrogenase complex dihydrolipoamide acyltransferase (E2) component